MRTLTTIRGYVIAAVLGWAVVTGSPIQAQSSADWTQYRYGPAHTGFTPVETTLSRSNVATLQPKWSVTLGPGGNAFGIGLDASATVVDGVIYQHSDYGYLYVLDAATGVELWHAFTGGYGSSQPAVADGTVYVGTINGVLAYPTTCSTPCAPLWTALAGLTVNPPLTLADGILYVGGYDGRLYALDATTGGIVWSADVNVSFYDPVWGPPAVANGLVFQPTDTGISAYPTTCRGPGCQPVWTRKTPYSVERSPAVADGVVYAVDDQGNLNAWDAGTGKPIWGAPTSYSPRGPVVAGNTVFVATGDGVLWAFPTDCRGNKCSPRWTSTPTHQGFFEPVVANGVVYVGSINGYFLNGMLFAFPTECTGFCRPLFYQDVDGAIESAPVVVNGVVYAGTLTGKLYAFGLP